MEFNKKTFNSRLTRKPSMWIFNFPICQNLGLACAKRTVSVGK